MGGFGTWICGDFFGAEEEGAGDDTAEDAAEEAAEDAGEAAVREDWGRGAATGSFCFFWRSSSKKFSPSRA